MAIGADLVVTSAGAGAPECGFNMKNAGKNDRPMTGEVLCRVWLDHLGRMCDRTDAVILGEDVEALHGFRVALRATRALQKLFASALPDAPQDFSGEFTWLARVTGPVRDLDVILQFGSEKLPALLQANPDELTPLLDIFQRQRDRAQKQLQQALRSPRYRRLMDNWQAYLQKNGLLQKNVLPLHTPPGWRRPMQYSAAVIVLKRSLQLLKMRRRIHANSDATDLHQMRIRAKRLRYLLQALQGQDICPHYTPLLHPLTRLQTVLGEHHDAVAMRERLLKIRDHSRQARAAGDVLSRWMLITDAQQHSASADFEHVFEQFVQSLGALH